ncbi:hypothetical protein AX17_002624 [Amanita inopinata Kibby_2008]|nr:hypothetical protein AX17_002624 [Amanita inopinata Kibby_2008]
MQRVLCIPELLDMIFSYLDLSSNATNARVCKRWSDVALDTLWREVEDIYRLCSLLAPLHVTDNSDYVSAGHLTMPLVRWRRQILRGANPLCRMPLQKFTRIPESNDWKRFERYSRRIRRLCYRPKDAKLPLAQSVFDDIARTRTSFAILPSMHTLEWDGPLALCVMFMHPNVRRFAVRLPDVVDLTTNDVNSGGGGNTSETGAPPPTSSLKPFFADVIDRMPNLSHLNIKMDFAINRIENDVVELLKGLKKLKKFTVPRFCVTSNVMNALSKLELLGCVEFQYSQDQGCGDPLDVTEFQPLLEEGTFPALWDLALTIGYDDASRFINASFAPTNLRMLYLDSQFFESPQHVKEILTVASENCQLLKSLALLSHVHPVNGVLETEPVDSQCITFDTLRPLLDFPNLTSLELVHQYPVIVTLDELGELAEKWPSLETLLLNNEPAFINHSRLTLDALLPFAKHCPRLHHLGLFINASTLGQPYHSTPTTSLSPSKRIRAPYNGPVFKSLRKLSMGVSLLADEKGVALFLSTICPLDCQLDSGVTWDDMVRVGFDLARAIQVRCDRWSRVEEMLPGMIELRLQERERTRELEKENEDLKMRNSVLLDKLGLTPKKVEDSCVAV